MKKILVIAVALILLLSLAACGGGGGGGGGDNGGSADGDGTAAPASTNNDDPCPCCPDCIQAECVCEECGDNDDYDCKCSAPGGGDSFTFLVEMDINVTASTGKSSRTIVETTVILNEFNSSSWAGETEAVGEHTAFGFEYEDEIIYCRDYDYHVILSDFDPQKRDSITLSIDSFCDIEECFTEMNLFYYGTVYGFIDEETGQYTFELPIEGGIAKLVNHWDDGVAVDMTITVTWIH